MTAPTEAGQFQDAGFDAVMQGPGSIDQHKPDEWSDAQAAQALDEIGGFDKYKAY